MRRAWTALAAVLLLVTAPGTAADRVVIYRCTDALGRLTVQNDTPCPKGSKEERRVMEAAPPGAAPPPLVATPAPAPPPRREPPRPPATPAPDDVPTIEGPPVADADRLPPPILFECRTFDAGRYLTESIDGLPQRCRPLGTTSLSGFGSGAGEACEMVSDQCQRVPDEQLCDAWQQRLREARSQARFGRPDLRETARADVERVARIARDSTCGRGGG